MLKTTRNHGFVRAAHSHSSITFYETSYFSEFSERNIGTDLMVSVGSVFWSVQILCDRRVLNQAEQFCNLKKTPPVHEMRPSLRDEVNDGQFL